MAGRSYSGGWRRRSDQIAAPPPFYAPLNPEHLNPTAEPEPGPIPWQSTVSAPVLPVDAMGGDPALPAPGGIGPVWEQHTPTVGTLPGLSQAEAQAARGAAHNYDDGSVAANSWTHTIDRDGAPHLDRIDLSGTGSDSPETVRLQITGVESPNDPGARRGHRLQRWYDRYIDMHRYDVEYPAKTVRNVHAAQPQNPPAVPTQRDFPLPSIVTALGIGTSDNFVQAQMRREPRRWGEASSDATSSFEPESPAQYGLTSWGS